nr:tetratricopeptide repeat protein [Shewanella zhuhaiensis]
MDAVDEYRGFDFYVLGREALGRGELADAKRYLNKFLRSTEYFHPAWFDIARVYHGLGDEEAAKAALRQALKLASQKEDLNRYNAKLQMLKTAAR